MKDDADAMVAITAPSQPGKYSTKQVAPYVSASEEVTTTRVSERQDEDATWLLHMEKQFAQIAGDDGEIDKEEFKSALNIKDCFLADRFFTLFDEDKSGFLTLKELIAGVKQISKGTQRDKLKFLFDVYDIDGSGSIDLDEMKAVLRSSVSESSMKINQEDLDELATLLFESADQDHSGAVSFDEMLAEFNKIPDALDSLTIRYNKLH